jgi:dipeptidyl aminopeptidase/acylaminoacyl peptidase
MLYVMNKFYTLVVLLFILIIPAEASVENNDKWNNFIKSTKQETVSLAPNGELSLFLHQIKYQSIKYLSQQRIPLAGLDFYLNLSSRIDTPQYSHATLINVSNNSKINIIHLKGVILDFNWSPDTQKIAFLIQDGTETHLWLYDIDKNTLHKLTNLNLSTSLGNRHLRWLPDSQALIVKQRSAISKKLESTERRPHIQSSDQQINQGRTHQNLLIDNKMRDEFIEITQTKLVKIALNGEISTLTKKNLFDDFSISPDGKYLLSSILPKTLSPYLPYKKWGRSYKIINLKKPQSIFNLPSLADKTNLKKSKDSVPLGARLVKWLPSDNSTVSWVEASDNGDMSSLQTYHDHIYNSASPFTENKTLLFQAQWRVHNILWGASGVGVLQEWRYDNKLERTTLISKVSSISTLIHQGDYRDKYNDFGDPHTQRTPEGFEVLVEGDNKLFFFASRKSKDGIRPLVKSYDITNNVEKTIFLSHTDSLEVPFKTTGSLLIIQKQNSLTAPQYYALTGRDFKKRMLIFANKNKNHFQNKPITLSYKRNDGLNLTGTLHLPNNYIKGSTNKIPAILWIYPDEFKSKKLSQQSTVRANLFRNFDPLSPLVFLHDDIAVFEAPMPITSFDGGEPNDDFINQIRLNAEAAINALEETGNIDVQNLAIMGHSYGAFTVANLLAHTDLFKVGIARSGAYNRTLTPFGFQGEKRKLWEAKDTYIKISPLVYADQINEPLLLIHGEKDQNSGTYPMQSTRMYQALIANKKTAQLITLPHEGHVYQAKENLSYLLTHQSEWIAKWLNTSE